MPGAVATTIVAKPFLAHARVLAQSFRRFHPGVPFTTLLADEVDGCFNPDEEPYDLISLDELKISNASAFRFQYSQQELSYAATPYLMAHLLDRGFSQVLFLKQESLVLGNLSDIFSHLNGAASVLLTPHRLEPTCGADRISRDLNVLLSGVYNVGCLGVAGTLEGRAFLSWWQDRLYRGCRHDTAEGMHFEQRWIDLVPSYFPGAQILRDRGVNIGHWNLRERCVRMDDDEVWAGSTRCRLFRFSGFDPGRPDVPTRHNPHMTMKDIGAAARIFDRFAHMLSAAGHWQTQYWPYAYGSFDDGTPIPNVVRQLYLGLGPQAVRFGNPFRSSGAGCFLNWLNETDGESGNPGITRLWHAIYVRRPDLKHAFPDLSGRDKVPFLNWAREHGVREHGVPERLAQFGDASQCA